MEQADSSAPIDPAQSFTSAGMAEIQGVIEDLNAQFQSSLVITRTQPDRVKPGQYCIRLNNGVTIEATFGSNEIKKIMVGRSRGGESGAFSTIERYVDLSGPNVMDLFRREWATLVSAKEIQMPCRTAVQNAKASLTHG